MRRILVGSLGWVWLSGVLSLLWGLTCCTGVIVPMPLPDGGVASQEVTRAADGQIQTDGGGQEASPKETKSTQPDALVGADQPGADAPAAAPVYFADMKPFLDEFCINCHGSSSSIGSVATYDHDLRKRTPVAFWGHALKRVSDQEMPPVKPDAHDAIARFEEGVALFKRWRDAGFPEGPNGSSGTNKPRAFEPMLKFPTSGTCEGKDPLPARLWRLTSAQVHNSIRDLFGASIKIPEITLSTSEVAGLDGKKRLFSNEAASINLNNDDLTHLLTVFRSVAQELLKKLPDAKACLSAKDELCVPKLIAKYGPQIWRRPLQEQERDGLFLKFQEVLAKTNRQTAMSFVFERLFLSPFFLFRSELGEPVAGRAGVNQLTPYETASWLSYTLWQSAPDQALLQAAADDQLKTQAQLLGQVTRMSQDDRIKRGFQRLFDDWLKLSQIKVAEKAKKLFPKFTVAMKEAMYNGSMALIDDVLWQRQGTLVELFTTNKVFANELTAPIYGKTLTGQQFQLITADPQQRAGLLTTPAFMGGHAGVFGSGFAHRGVFFLEEFTCFVFPSPPDGAVEMGNTIGDQLDQSKMLQRDIQEAKTAAPTCRSCHEKITPAGAAFEMFDPIGQFRLKEKGMSIDTKGHIKGIDGIDIQFTSGVDLVRQLAKTKRFQRCVSTKLYTHTFGIKPKGEQSCMLAGMHEHLEKSNFTLKTLYEGLVRSENVLLRKAKATP